MAPDALRCSLLLLLTLLGGCGEPLAEFEVREGANGLVLKVRELQPITVDGGQPALYLAFQPNAPIDDAAALRAEIAGLWNHFRPEVQAREWRLPCCGPARCTWTAGT